MAKDPGRVLIFDTTLRDGEQSPGASLNLEEKLAIAQQLARLGVDIIEAGFPFASAGDFEAVQRIAQQVGGEKGPIICGLARASRGDIKACADAVAPAPRRRIHTFLATSDIHLEHKLRKSRKEVLAIVPEMVAYARSLVDDVEFSCEDAGRSDPEFLYEVIEAAIAAGAGTINIPDTVGYTTPAEFGSLIAGIDRHVPNINEAVLSVHGHNDLGLAVGMVVQPNKAIVGANAFAHESGIHQDGVLKNRLTYEIVDARTVGLSDNRISLGKLSGRSAVRARLEELGYDLSREDLDEAFARFKDLADRKREITDRDLEAIVSEQVQQPEARYQLKLVQVSCGSSLRPTATVTLADEEGREQTAAAIGTGPVDAVCRALNALAEEPNELVEFSVKSVTEGIDAMGEVTIRLRREGQLFSGHSADTDVVVAAAQAFVNALNRLVAGASRSAIHPQRDHAVLETRPSL
jgi:isopropylmalate/homocitrate/citramalate synthase